MRRWPWSVPQISFVPEGGNQDPGANIAMSDLLLSHVPAKPIRVFIAYDFALIPGTVFSNVLEEAKSSQPTAKLDIHYAGAADDPMMQGTVWSSLVRKEIGLADQFLAFIDLPNANVGFEIGYAFGCNKPVAVYRFRSSEHLWLKQPPLRGHFKHQLDTPEGIHDAILTHQPLTLTDPPSSGDEVIVLCPKTGGSTFLRQIDSAWNWMQPPLGEWDIETLPTQFANTGLVVWIVVPHGQGEQERDGAENASLSILAGYAESRPEIELKVLVHTGARIVADVEHIAKPFTTNLELKAELSTIAAEWSATVAARRQPTVPVPTDSTAAAPALVLRKPASTPPHPDDPFPDTADTFIGRESLLGLAGDAVDGLMERFRSRTVLPGSRGIRLIWAHGFGGMGKSWYLHRIRCQASEQHSEIQSLIVDWDKPEWLAPLTGEPRVAVEVFDLLAIRLMQRLGMEAADAYWLAKARVEEAATAHKLALDRFEAQLHLAGTSTGERIEAHLRQLLGAENLWHDDDTKRDRNIQILRGDRARYRDLFGAWCRETGETDSCVICPNRALAEGLREALRKAMQSHPLIVVLDTCEVLSDDLDAWLRELFVPLFREPVPLLVLMGSRLRPDLHQLKGSRRGWLPEIPAAVLRVDDFGELLRFTVHEIESALGRLRRPVEDDTSQLAEVLHRVTLGVPLAVRGLLDLHENGDPVLQNLSAPDDDDIPLSERDAVRQVIGLVADRFLLNLEHHPEREDDLKDIIALAILPTIDHATLKAYWNNHSPKERLRVLARRYSLVSDGDLHPSVRTYLRRHWRVADNRPSPFEEVVGLLSRHAAALRAASPLTNPAERIAELAAELNLRSWKEEDRIVNDIARAFCLARLYELDCQLLETLLAELPLAGPSHATARKLWHRDDDACPANRAMIDWLRDQCDSSTVWTEEEQAALDLLDGIATVGRNVEPKVALAALGMLEKGRMHFDLVSLPNASELGEAYFACAHALDPNIPHEPRRTEWLQASMLGYERAIWLRHLESVALNNVGNLYQDSGQFENSECAYHKSIELDPKNAYPHNGLGNLYRDHLGQPEKAEQEYLKAIELDPNDAYPHNGLGNLYQGHHGQPEKAEQEYLKAIELDPKFTSPHNGLGNLYQDHLGQPEKAEQEYLKAIELEPKFAYPHNGLGYLYQVHLGQPEKAEQEYLKAIELDPKFASPHNGLGLLFADSERWDDASACFAIAMVLDMKRSTGQRCMAWIALLSRDDVNEARKWMEQAVAIEQEQPGTALAEMAVNIWAGDWSATEERFASWVRELSKTEEWFVWAGHRRIAALVRKVHSLGGLNQVAEIFRSVADRPCWRPWSQAVHAILDGADRTSLPDPKAVKIYDLLAQSN